jgi:glycosyltransferase involved in cell wall biosynthesis
VNFCLISQEYPPETNWGGIATYTQTLARQLVKMGQRVHVVTLAEGEEYTADDLGVTVHRVSRTPQVPYAQAELNSPNHGVLNFSQRVYEKVKEIYQKEPIDVIEAPETCAQALLTFKRMDEPVKITRLHTPFFWVRHLNNMPETPEHIVRDQLEKLQIDFSSAVTSPTGAMAEVVRNQWGTENIEVIPNFFNLKTYVPDVSVYEQHLKELDYVLFFGRLEYRKGVRLLAQALPEIFSKHKKIAMAFIGSDSTYHSKSMKATILKQLRAYDERVKLIDNIPHAALYPIIEKSRFIVLPSLWENFPYTCIEAMALGKTVVASNSGGFPEIIEDGKDGILFPPGDVEALKTSIFQCLESVDLDRMGKKAKEKASKYDAEKIVGQMLEFYESLKADETKRKKKSNGQEPLKVAYILRHIPVPSETFVINEIIALQELGVEIYPVSLLPAQECHELLMSKIEKPVLDLSDKKLEGKAASSPFYQSAADLANENGISSNLAWQAALVADDLKEKGIDHIHAHFVTESALVAMLASKLTGIPFSVTAHAYDIFRASNPNTIKDDSPERRLRLLLANSNRVFTISDFNKNYILSKTDRLFTEKIKVIPCGIDPDNFEFVRRGQPEVITLLSVGRFVEKKGFEYLLRSFKSASDVLENIRLRLIGEGQLKDQVQNLAKELGIEDKTTFLGAVSSDVVLEEMKRADIFALHSVTGSDGDMEGIPVSIMEASATGLPVISTMHSGIPDLVLHGVTGFLSKEKNVEEFLNYMLALISSPELRQRMGEAGRRHVSERFNLHTEAGKLKAHFMESVVAARAAKVETTAWNLVDIIMPTYNPDLSLIRRAIQSIVNQEFRDWKLFIVKDGGEADLSGILREFNDSRINDYEIPHSGKSVALNYAISKGQAKYVAYLDDDDLWYPNHLQVAISYMVRNNVRFVHTDSDEVTLMRKEKTFDEVERESLNKGVVTDMTLFYISHINVVHERELFNRAGLYDESREFFIDWDMLLRLAMHSKPHHLHVLTCEHYMYKDQDMRTQNIITSVHQRNREVYKKAQDEFFIRAFQMLTPDDFVEIMRDSLCKVKKIKEQSDVLRKREVSLTRKALEEEPMTTSSTELPNFAAVLAERERQLDDHKQRLEGHKLRLKDRERELAEREERIQDVLNSGSWKIARPLRRGSEILKIKKKP